MKYRIRVVAVVLFIGIIAQAGFAQGAGYALQFIPGDFNWVEMDNFNMTPSDGFAIECWVNITGTNPEDGAGYQMFVGDINANYRLGVNPDFHPYINIGDRSDLEDTSFTFSMNTWYHYAMVGSTNPDSTHHVELYVNGVLIFSSNSDSTSKSYPTCGSLLIGNSDNNHMTNGIIDEVRFWKGPRTTQQIRENMHLTVPGNSTNLLGYWQLNEGSGNTTADSSMYENTGEAHNTLDWVVSTAVLGGGVSYMTTITAAEPHIGGITTPALGRKHISWAATPQSFPGTGIYMLVGGIYAADTIVVSRINSYPGGTAPSYPGLNAIYTNYWVFHQYGGPLASTQVYFILNSGTVSLGDITTPSNLKLFTRDSTSAGAWTKIDSAASASGDSVFFENLSSSGQFEIGTTGNSALPLEAVSFTAQKVTTGVELNWETISEVNTYGFYVERSATTDKSFAMVSGLIQGQGTTLQPHYYSWTDTSVSAGTYYYRLRQVDLDGTFTYTKEIVIVTGVASVTEKNTPNVFALHQNYPNPFNPSTAIQYDLPKPSVVTLKIFNVLGEVVTTLVKGTQQPGDHVANWDATGAASGVYLYRIEAISSAGVFTQTKKLILMK
jgi:hypothetical protein